jgi:hypothetical protein
MQWKGHLPKKQVFVFRIRLILSIKLLERNMGKFWKNSVLTRINKIFLVNKEVEKNHF